MTSILTAVVLALLLQPPAKPDEPTPTPSPAPAAVPPSAPTSTPAPASEPAPPQAPSPEARIANWREDVKFLAQELPKQHPRAFATCKKEDFEAAAAALDKAIPELSDDQIVVGMMKLAAMVGDSHTGIGPQSLRTPPRYFPLAFAVFSDGPVIGAARESQKDLIGCTIVKIGQTPIDEALRRVGKVAAFENEGMFKLQAPRLLAVAQIAHGVGLIPSTEAMPVVVRDKDGEERTVDLTPMAPGEKLSTREIADSALPLYRQKRATANWYELIPPSQALYFHYERSANEPEQKVVVLTNEILTTIDAKGVERVIVDLRNNGGGNAGFLLAFIQGLKFRQTASRPGSVIVLVGPGTFSSALANAATLKIDAGAVFMGEPTGPKPGAGGETRAFKLPHSQIEVRYSAGQSEDGGRPAIEPDVKVELSSTDYLEGKDPVLEAALKYEPRK